jgi:hypothetical protein
VTFDRIRAGLDQRCTDASSVDQTRRSLLAKIGAAAGVAAVIAFPDAARAAVTRFTDTVEVIPPSGSPALIVVPSGNVPVSASAGGALNVDNSGSTGAGAVLYSGRGADALGRLLLVNQANAGNPQHAVRIENAGIAHTVSIFHDPAGGAGDPTAEAVDIVSTNELDTALGVRGRETGKGTVKITHEKPSGPDADASALSIALAGAGTACQGIYIGNDAGNPTTGDLLHIRNGGPGSDRLRLTADGELQLPVGGVEAAAFAVNASIPGNGALNQTFVQVSGVNGEIKTFSSFQHQLRLRPLSSPDTGSLTNVFGFYAPPVSGVEAGWTVNNYSLLRLEAPGGTGTIMNLTGLDIRDLKTRGMNTYSIRSFGPGVHMRHSGAVNIGSQATPATALHVRGNPSYHGSLTLDQETTDAPAPSARQQARLYIKNGKLVVQWNDGGKTLFTTIPLEPPGPYPVTVAVTTDTTAP